MPLNHTKILLGVTGGVAAYKAAELCRLLIKAGADVRVAMTDAAQQFVTPLTFQALSGKPVLTSLWASAADHSMDHIEASRGVDVILVAPATADFMAKLVHGRADDVLSSLCLARQTRLVIAPAMNQAMWAAAATQRNFAQLSEDGVDILGPATGEQACGEVGLGRMLEPAEIVNALPGLLGRGLLAGKRVLITAGPTFEPIDPVRGITNRSSGKMGYAIAQAAVEAGAEVCVVSGPTALPVPSRVRRVDVQTAQQMHAAVIHEVAGAAVFISVAAVADYRVASPSEQKLKKSEYTLTLALERNPDILAEVAALPNTPFCVGFAAETEKLLEHGEAKRRQKNIPLLVGNLAQQSLDADETELCLFDDAGAHPWPKASKLAHARRLIAHIATLIP
ncbi:MAG: bifunctional phosphopantothenoylcysteine decarboxylase/phosphopantothenate--cysteine ligase CoaBC [Thiobacillus sp.]